MTLGAYIRDADDASFLLRRCVHSPGAIAGCPGEQNYCSVPNPEKQTHFKKKRKIWAFWADFGSCVLEIDYFWDRGNRSRANPTIIETSQTPYYCSIRSTRVTVFK